MNRQIAWYEVFLFAQRFAAAQGVDLDPLLLAGTPQWCRMADDDPRKLAALIAGGVREALRNDARQGELADASRAIAATPAVDWSRVARPKPASYIERERRSA